MSMHFSRIRVLNNTNWDVSSFEFVGYEQVSGTNFSFNSITVATPGSPIPAGSLHVEEVPSPGGQDPATRRLELTKIVLSRLGQTDRELHVWPLFVSLPPNEMSEADVMVHELVKTGQTHHFLEVRITFHDGSFMDFLSPRVR